MKIRICGNGVFTYEDLHPGGIHPSNISEILYIVDGEVRLHWSGNQCVVRAPAVLLIAPDTPHRLENLGQPVRYCFLELVDADENIFNTRNVDLWNFMQVDRIGELDKNALSTVENLVSEELLSIDSFISMIYKTLDFVHAMHITGSVEEHQDIHQVCELEVQKALLLIHHILVLNQKGTDDYNYIKKWSLEEAVNASIAYLEWRYKEDITLQMLADRVRFNPSYLIRIFKKYTNTTPFQYLQDLRMKAAVNYLTGSDIPILRIVEETGFNSIHYFSRLFKEKYGESPARWRKKMKENKVLQD